MGGVEGSQGEILPNFQGDKWKEGGHGPRVAQALLELRRPENRLEVLDLALPYQEQVLSLIGIEDRDPQRNLGDYQNIGYFLIREKSENRDGRTAEAPEVVVIDPGLRDGHWIRSVLGIKKCHVIFTHFHLDHWIGYEPYQGEAFFASPLCKMVLTQMAGAEKTGKSIFVEGRLTDYHRRPLPLRAANDAERLLPLKEEIHEVTGRQPYRNQSLALEFFELPYGQTEGTLYGLLETGEVKILFASDLFVSINNELKIEPHYAFKPKGMVIEDIVIVLRALLGKELRISADPPTLTYLKRIAQPDKIALGHGLIDFWEYREKIAHLLEELEEMLRINREHII
ncbi:MAG: MBL fold metallo-hydrolase [Firmicutes bacterium]|nr:MBL fold metallo-hydrolase [Bacillota bacterium]